MKRFAHQIRGAELSRKSAGTFPVKGDVGVRLLPLKHEHRMPEQLITRSSSVQFILTRRYHKQLQRNLAVLESEESVLQFIKNNVVYNTDGIIGINKPPDLPVSRGGQPRDGPGSPISISSLMHRIVDLIDSPAAEIAVGVDKEASGLVLLGESKAVAEKILAKLQQARRERQFIRTYKSIVCGIPESREGVIKLYLGSDVIGGKRMVVAKHDPSRSQIKDGHVWSAETNYRVISENSELRCALVELRPLRVRRHQLQVQLTDILCPALGDHAYSQLVQTILGVPMLVDPHRTLHGQSGQVLTPLMRKAVSLTNQQASRLPLFIHHHRLILPKWRGQQDVHIEAPIPAHFSTALKELGLGDGREGEEEEQRIAAS